MATITVTARTKDTEHYYVAAEKMIQGLQIIEICEDDTGVAIVVQNEHLLGHLIALKENNG